MKIFYLIGKSNVGKSSIQAVLLRRTDIQLSPLLEATDRPMRPGEGNTHVFLSREDMEHVNAIEKREYNVNHPDKTWHYATIPVPTSLDAKVIYVGCGPLSSYEALRKYYGEEIVKPIYITVEDATRLIRGIHRDGGNQNALLETCRRFIADTNDFRESELKRLGITRRETFRNDDQIQLTISSIVAYIMRNTREERDVNAPGVITSVKDFS